MGAEMLKVFGKVGVTLRETKQSNPKKAEKPQKQRNPKSRVTARSYSLPLIWEVLVLVAPLLFCITSSLLIERFALRTWMFCAVPKR